jgi:hypothetical protein
LLAGEPSSNHGKKKARYIERDMRALPNRAQFVTDIGKRQPVTGKAAGGRPTQSAAVIELGQIFTACAQTAYSLVYMD